MFANIVVPLLVMSMLASSADAQTPRFRVIDITKLNVSGSGFIPDINSIGSMAINNHGEVVYGRSHSGTLHPWVWIPESNPNYNDLPVGLTDLFDRSGQTGVARDINDSGLIVGQNGYGTYGLAGEAAPGTSPNTTTWRPLSRSTRLESSRRSIWSGAGRMQ